MLPVFVILDPVTIIKPRTSGVKHTIFYLMLIDELRSCSSLAVLWPLPCTVKGHSSLSQHVERSIQTNASTVLAT